MCIYDKSILMTNVDGLSTRADNYCRYNNQTSIFYFMYTPYQQYMLMNVIVRHEKKLDIMPWTKNDYPDSMKNLSSSVRKKAIDIGNTLVEDENMEEGRAIATAISRAKDWATNHGKNAKSNSKSKTTDQKHHGQDQYVVPTDNGWAVKREGAERKQYFSTKKDAIATGKERAKKHNATITIQRKDGTVQNRYSYNPNKG